MSLFDTKKDFMRIASSLPKRYEDYDIDELANKYCEAKDNNNKRDINIYLSALMLRFWYTIDKMYQKCKSSGYEHIDCYYKLYECIEAAMKYRVWQDPNKKTNAQACINQILKSRGVPALIYEANLQKNFRATVSLDESLNEDDNKNTLGDLIEDTSDDYKKDDLVVDVVQMLIKENKVVEAIIADTIAHNDVFKQEEKIIKTFDDNGNVIDKHKEYKSEFWPFKVVQELNELDEDYLEYFKDKYIINNNMLTSAFNALVNANNQKKYKYLDKTLSFLRESYSFN